MKEMTNCILYASEGERPWIENIDLQYKDRPIPNFYHLVNKSVSIDNIVKDREKIELEENLTIEVVKSGGHSLDGVSYLLNEKAIIFTGDAIPVKGDIPIYINKRASLESLEKLKKLNKIQYYCPAWDKVYTDKEGKQAINQGEEFIHKIQKEIDIILRENKEINMEQWKEFVCERLGMEQLKGNPLFLKTIACHLN